MKKAKKEIMKFIRDEVANKQFHDEKSFERLVNKYHLEKSHILILLWAECTKALRETGEIF